MIQNTLTHNFRQVSLTERTTFFFENKGTVLQNSILTHDFDNDDHIEFIMGSIYGSLVVFKHKNMEPVYRCDHLGTITCITSTTVKGVSYLVVVCAEGECHLFQSVMTTNHHHHTLTTTTTTTTTDTTTTTTLHDSHSSSIHQQQQHSPSSPTPAPPSCEHISPLFTRRIPCNITCALMIDYDMDGEEELIIGSNDRNLYIYKMNIAQQSFSLLKKIAMDDNQVFSLSKHHHHQHQHQHQHRNNQTSYDDILIGFAGGGYAVIDCAASTHDHCCIRFFKATTSTTTSATTTTTVATSPTQQQYHHNNNSQLINHKSNSQHNNNNSRKQQVRSRNNRDYDEEDDDDYYYDDDDDEDDDEDEDNDEEYDRTNHANQHHNTLNNTNNNMNSNSTREENEMLVFSKQSSVISKPLIVLGNLSWCLNDDDNDDDEVKNGHHDSSGDRDDTCDDDGEHLAAFVTLDGKVTVHLPLDGFRSVSTSWTMDLHQEIVSIYQAPFVVDCCAPNERESSKQSQTHLCVTTWDGNTFVIDQYKNVVCFNLQERISAFYVGHYSLVRDQPPVLCLFYVTFTDKIYVYYNVELTSVPPLDLKHALLSDPEAKQLLSQVFEKLHIFNINEVESSKLLHSVLYDFDETQIELLNNWERDHNVDEQSS